jgi:hypothetical protein
MDNGTVRFGGALCDIASGLKNRDIYIVSRQLPCDGTAYNAGTYHYYIGFPNIVPLL